MSYEVFIDPVVANGHTHEQAWITRRICDHNISPMPTDVWNVNELVPNIAVRSILEGFITHTNINEEDSNVSYINASSHSELMPCVSVGASECSPNILSSTTSACSTSSLYVAVAAIPVLRAVKNENSTAGTSISIVFMERKKWNNLSQWSIRPSMGILQARLPNLALEGGFLECNKRQILLNCLHILWCVC